ncbi:putative Cysteine desulfurase [Blattamonas nauphoetae]|uniref:Cysteine desulfurase n=1 Tax=Blattamonas nauphoetae TaxID=2049346 RepID=A0ABQ9WZ96_9EUKA|nr:putative Cysteine desulfurase [Blattamonas nauphoetae]
MADRPKVPVSVTPEFFKGLTLVGARRGQVGTETVNKHHLVKNCESDQLMRTVVTDSQVDNQPPLSQDDLVRHSLNDTTPSEQTSSSFKGSIIIHRNAPRSIANQLSNSLLLLTPNTSCRPKVSTIPSLIIENEDVECNHGATCGELDKSPLFFFSTRGIGDMEALAILVKAFSDEVLSKIVLGYTLTAKQHGEKARLPSFIRSLFFASFDLSVTLHLEHLKEEAAQKLIEKAEQEKRRQARQLHAFTFDPDKEPASPFDTATTLKEFPAIIHPLTNRPVVYLDNAATTPRSTTVFDRLRHFDKFQNENVHRAVHHLSEEATREYEGARKSIARFVGAEKDRDIVFTSGTTDSINTIVNSFIIPTMRHWIESTDRSDFVIVLTELEHHANIEPLQMALNMTETDTSS